MRIVFKAEYARLIQPFISTEATRYYLNGFFVHPDPVEGVRIAATDGHRLGVFHDEDGLCLAGQGAIVSLPKEAIRLCKPGSRWEPQIRWLEIDLRARTASIHFGDPRETPSPVGTFNDVLIDGTFPEYERVVPALPDPSDLGASFVNQAYRASYLADFGKVVDCKEAVLRVLAHEKGGPAIVFVDGRQDFFGVLMPFRDDERECLPEWWTRKPKVLALPAPPGAPLPEPVTAE